MEEPIQILVDALSMNGWEWDDIVFITAGIGHPMAILDMAEWVAEHPNATKQELITKGNLLIIEYML